MCYECPYIFIGDIVRIESKKRPTGIYVKIKKLERRKLKIPKFL